MDKNGEPYNEVNEMLYVAYGLYALMSDSESNDYNDGCLGIAGPNIYVDAVFSVPDKKKKTRNKFCSNIRKVT